VTPPLSSREKSVDPQLREVDALFRTAGLVRSRRAGARIARAPRLDGAMPEELAIAAPDAVIASNGVHLLQVPSWNELPWLWHGFSTRKGGGTRAYCADGGRGDVSGELNLGFTAHDDRETVAANRRLLAEAVTGDSDTKLVTIRQFHSNVVAGATRKPSDPQKAGVPGDGSSSLGWKADGLITAEPGLLLAIQTADCIPVLIADRKQHVVAAFHAGWRGTVKRIVELGVGKMRLEFGSQPGDLIAAIGPGIGACCYAIGEEVRSEFESQFSYANELFHDVYDTDSVRLKYPMLFLTQRAPGHSPLGPNLHLDLIEANRRQLVDAGLKPRAIRVVGGCTSCRPDLFFSHRASRGHAGRMMSVIGIRPSLKQQKLSGSKIGDRFG
jgi:purine-nucleoside/S-methyl-5'-thioadenosine phosphorylase / adenosine deaminase